MIEIVTNYPESEEPMPVTAAPLDSAEILAETRTKLHGIIAELNAGYFERSDAIDALMLGVLAREHVFLLGPPGTAKSALIKSFIGAFPGADYFKMMMYRNLPDAAVLGPYDIPGLRDKGDFHRKIKGFLPTAQFAFLDELGKMGPTLGHSILSIMNEREYTEVTDQGKSIIPVPLHSMFSGSNELLVNESEEAAAAWDRLLVRVEVGQIKSSANFRRLLLCRDEVVVTAGNHVSYPVLDHITQVVVPAIRLNDVADSAITLRQTLASEGVTVSDRRWKKSMQLVQAQAFLSGHAEATTEDMEPLRFSLWETPEQRLLVERLVLSVTTPNAGDLLDIIGFATEVMMKIKELSTETNTSALMQYGTQANAKLRTLSTKLEEISRQTNGSGKSELFTKAKKKLHDAHAAVYQQALGIELPATAKF